MPVKILLIKLRLFQFIVLAAFFAAFSCNSAWAEKLTLEECYKRAIEQSESLQRRKEQIIAAEERYNQAIAAIMPNLHFRADQRVRNSDSFGLRNDGNNQEDDEGFSQSRDRKHPFESAFTVSQPIFQGFRDILLAQATEAEKRALGYDESRAVQVLYQNVAELFYQTNFYSKDLELLSKAEKVLNDRVKELREFVGLGKSRESEILAAQADISGVQAGKERVKGLMLTSRELLAFLLNMPADSIELVPSEGPTILPLDHYLDAGKERLDLKAQQERVAAFEKQLTAAERLWWPSISLDGNYYTYEDPDQNREWEVLFRLDVPIFEGGALRARAREQAALTREQELQLNELRRLSERDIRVAFNEVQSGTHEVDKLKQATDATKKNYNAQREDYKNGVVTNIDVLQALEQAVEAERRLLEARTKVNVSKSRLQVAAGVVQ